MRKLERCTVALLVIALTILSSHVALAESTVEPLPDLIFKGTVMSMLGHEQGYIRPMKGARIEIDFSKLEQSHIHLQFEGDDGGVETGGYVPLLKALKLIDTEGPATAEGWRSFRAVSEVRGHKVTVDAVRKPGTGHPDNVEMWVLIESHQRITGIVEITGRVYKKCPGNQGT